MLRRPIMISGKSLAVGAGAQALLGCKRRDERDLSSTERSEKPGDGSRSSRHGICLDL
jgi:hypothetical protein